MDWIAGNLVTIVIFVIALCLIAVLLVKKGKLKKLSFKFFGFSGGVEGHNSAPADGQNTPPEVDASSGKSDNDRVRATVDSLDSFIAAEQYCFMNDVANAISNISQGVVEPPGDVLKQINELNFVLCYAALDHAQSIAERRWPAGEIAVRNASEISSRFLTRPTCDTRGDEEDGAQRREAAKFSRSFAASRLCATSQSEVTAVVALPATFGKLFPTRSLASKLP